VAKLEAFGLLPYVDLDVAATGSDAEARCDLPDIARRRAAAKYGVWFAGSATVVVGDTIHDVEAALAAGAASIAIATGKDSEATLAQAGAQVVLPNLTNPRTLPVVLRHLREQHAASHS
jgi:phosphoglycolate phosphatase-like HAD superfamily hydrolase